MKLAFVFILVFVTMSYQQQFQKKFYWAGENNQQKEQPSGIYNYDPFTIRNYLSPMDPAEGMVRGLLPHQATMMEDNEKYDVIMDQVVEPSFTEFWDDSDVSQLMLDYYRPRQKHYFLDSSPNIRSRFWYMRPDRPNGYQYSSGNHRRPDMGDFHFQPTEREAIQSRRRYPASLPTNVDLAAQERLFGLLSGGFGGAPVYVSNTSAARPFLGGLFTRTYISVSTSTITTVSTPVCIPSALLPSGVTPCARRRRGMNIPLDFYLPNDGTSEISPTAMEKIVPTSMTTEDSINSYEEKNARFNKFLASSKDDVVVIGDDDEDSTRLRDKRQFIISTTSTMITYSIITNFASTKSIVATSIGNAASSTSITFTTVNCIPPGVRVC